MKIKKLIAVVALLFMCVFMGYSQTSSTSVNMEIDVDESVLEPGSGENCESTTIWVPVNIAGFIISLPVTVNNCED